MNPYNNEDESQSSDIELELDDIKQLSDTQRRELLGDDNESTTSHNNLKVAKQARIVDLNNTANLTRLLNFETKASLSSDFSGCEIISQDGDKTQSSNCPTALREDYYMRKAMLSGGSNSIKNEELTNAIKKRKIDEISSEIQRLSKIKEDFANEASNELQQATKPWNNTRNDQTKTRARPDREILNDIEAISKASNKATRKELAIHQAIRSRKEKCNRLITFISCETTNINAAKIKKQIETFEYEHKFDAQRKIKTWTSEKDKLVFAEFMFSDDKELFMDNMANKEVIKMIPNFQNKEARHYRRKPIRLMISVNPKIESRIIEQNLKKALNNKVEDFRETKPNAMRRSQRMILWNTDEEGFNQLQKMEWRIPYTFEQTGKSSFIEVKLDGRVIRCNQCYSLMGNKPHNCQGQRCLNCNEIGHSKTSCRQTNYNGCINCKFSLPSHNAMSDSCPAYIQKVFDLLMEADIPDEFVTTKGKADEGKIKNLIKITNM